MPQGTMTPELEICATGAPDRDGTDSGAFRGQKGELFRVVRFTCPVAVLETGDGRNFGREYRRGPRNRSSGDEHRCWW